MTDNKSPKGTHSKVKEAFSLMKGGRMDRREFVRVAALLGVSAGAAYKMSGLKPAQAAGTLPFAADDANAKKGGILRVAMQVQKMEDPANYSWVQVSNQSRQSLEYVSMTGSDNVTRPYLAESWKASDDLKTWTFKLREGILFHNGDELTAETIKWNVERWCDPKIASSIVGLPTFAQMVDDVDSGEKDDAGNPKKHKVLRAGAFEVVDKYTFKLNLAGPNLSVPEDWYHYPAQVLHPSFVPPLANNMIGTGPYMMTELKVGEKCILKRVTKMADGRDFTYWGGDVYLDEIHYINYEAENQLTALAAGDVDAIYEFDTAQMEFAKTIENASIVAARTAQTNVFRMQVDQKPFDNKKLRQAFAKGIDNAAIKALVYTDGGDVGENHHVSPIHPEYFKLPEQKRDVAAAKALLKEAGLEGGIELTIDVGNTEGPWQQAMAEAARDQLKEVGIKLNVNVMPASKYWEIWDKTAFGATSWTHRPLGVMVLSLAYKSGVPWNESHYANPEFDAALADAGATLDVEARRAKMEKLEKILQDDAVFVQPLWRPIYSMAKNNVHGYPAHPTQYHQFHKVWVG